MEALGQLLKYTVWANNTILTLFEKYGPQTPAPSLRLMSHLVNAQATWLARLRDQIATVGIWDEHDLATCKRMNTETLSGFEEFLQNQKPGSDLHKKVPYKNSMGMPFENSILDILLQMLSHGSYHRGQIAMQLRQHGLEPVNTDYITFVRTA
jgi:uncharacterized damage-inducible protein DinB